MKTRSLLNKISSKGFTLIELLVVIAILGILAAGILVAINPAQKINQANDANMKNNVGQIATALQAYYTVYQAYPATLATLETAKELKVLPAAPTGYAYSYSLNVASTDVQVSFTLLAPAVAGNNIWCWRSATGVAQAQAAPCTP